MEPVDPEGKTYKLRTVAEDGGVRETEITAGQAQDFAADGATARPVGEEEVLIDDNGAEGGAFRRLAYLPRFVRHYRNRRAGGMSVGQALPSARQRMRRYRFDDPVEQEPTGSDLPDQAV